MFNLNNNNQSSDDEEAQMTKKLHILTIMTVILAVSRLVSLEILLMFSDLLTALMIYFYSQAKNKCMAIFCMINGVIGIIYAITKLFSTYSQWKLSSFGFYYTVLTLICLYAIIVYIGIC